MPVVLYRVDERLIHGQVVVGWGMQLRPDRIIVVDDELAGSDWEQELYMLGLPPQIEAGFHSVASARARLREWQTAPERALILTRDLDTMNRLAEDGLLRGQEVNIGGIHHAPGRRSVLPYVFLSETERQAMERLVEEGVIVSARDLPGARRVEADELLSKKRERT